MVANCRGFARIAIERPLEAISLCPGGPDFPQGHALTTTNVMQAMENQGSSAIDFLLIPPQLQKSVEPVGD
jgi:hypothetical protein